MKIPELESIAKYQAFLKEKKYKIELPGLENYRGGAVKLYTGNKTNTYSIANCQILNHPNCCGSKLIHSSSLGGLWDNFDEEDCSPAKQTELHKYIIAGALLWCKLAKNASASYIVASNQGAIEAALKAL